MCPIFYMISWNIIIRSDAGHSGITWHSRDFRRPNIFLFYPPKRATLGMLVPLITFSTDPRKRRLELTLYTEDEISGYVKVRTGVRNIQLILASMRGSERK